MGINELKDWVDSIALDSEFSGVSPIASKWGHGNYSKLIMADKIIPKQE